MSTWQSVVRYGVVKTEETQDKWTYCSVQWVNDGIYNDAMKHLSSLRGGQDHTKHIYRVDELLFIDINKQFEDLRDIKKKLKQ